MILCEVGSNDEVIELLKLIASDAVVEPLHTPMGEHIYLRKREENIQIVAVTTEFSDDGRPELVTKYEQGPIDEIDGLINYHEDGNRTVAPLTIMDLDELDDEKQGAFMVMDE